MVRSFLRALSLGLVLAVVVHAADRKWQTGRWTGVHVSRQTVDFGPGSTPFDHGRSTPTMKAMADVREYVIETDDVRVELKDVVKVDHRSVDAVVGALVTFALEKNTIYIRDDQGIEHKFRVTKQTRKAR